MTKYVALLRGINVGGKNPVKMSELREVFERAGFSNVATYINSGNVLFESEETSRAKLTEKIEKMLSKAFAFNLRIVLESHENLKNIVSDAPDVWKKPNDIRMYVAFVKEPTTPKDVLKEIELRENVDSVKEGMHVVYMTIKLAEITKSKINRLAAKKFYQQITIRNYNTTKKLLELMEN